MKTKIKFLRVALVFTIVLGLFSFKESSSVGENIGLAKNVSAPPYP